jgi:DNA-binding transcriptional regulator LsrR (DeoR family)
MITTSTAAVIALVLLPLIVILWVTESKTQRQTRQAKRLSRHYGLSQRQISQQLGISQSTVSRRLAHAF